MARFASAQADQSLKSCKKAMRDLDDCERLLGEASEPQPGDPPGWHKFKLYHATRSLTKADKALHAALAYAKASLDSKAINAVELAVRRYELLVELVHRANSTVH